MDVATLRALQAPLKQKYRDEPRAAMVTALAEGRPGDGLTCAVDIWGAKVIAGLHPAVGGDGSKACSADILLDALVACAGVTLNSVATAMGVTLTRAVVRAEGKWDARGTLGVSRETPVGITDIELSFDLETDADGPARAKLIELTERYCVIYQTLRNAPRMGTMLRS
ncbi:MAG: OsmC family peroxiredoxin [Gemmatimonadetes bacterium]|nr:OsmC family peroxiredoxin [Gemmatimonadota bacterium]